MFDVHKTKLNAGLWALDESLLNHGFPRFTPSTLFCKASLCEWNETRHLLMLRPTWRAQCAHALPGNVDISGNRPARHVEVCRPINLCWRACVLSLSSTGGAWTEVVLPEDNITHYSFSFSLFFFCLLVYFHHQDWEPAKMCGRHADLQNKGSFNDPITHFNAFIRFKEKH